MKERERLVAFHVSANFNLKTQKVKISRRDTFVKERGPTVVFDVPASFNPKT